MGILAPSSAIVRYDLSLRREDWDQITNEEAYIGMKVMPAAGVAKASSNFTRIGVDATMVPVDSLVRQPRSTYKRKEFGWKQDSYNTQEHGVEETVDDAEIEMYGDFLPAEQIAAQRACSHLLAEHEQAVASAVFNSSGYSGARLVNLAGGGGLVPWQTIATANPVKDVVSAKAVLRTYGVRANAMVIPEITLDWLMQCQAVIDRCKYWGGDDPKNITLDMLKALFRLKYIFVGDGFKNASGDGQTPSIARFWDPTMVWVGRVAEEGSPLTAPSVCVGRTVMFTEQNAQIPGAGETGEPAIIMEEYREEQRRGGVIRARWNWQLKPFDDPMGDNNFFRAGVLFTGVTDGTLI